MTKSGERWWALAGPAFAVLFWAVVFTLEGDTPGEKASAAEVVDYFNGHKGRTIADVFLAPLLVALLLLSVAYLVARLRDHERGTTSRLGRAMLAMGTAVWAAGALLGSVASLTLVSSADNGQVEIAHTVNVLANSLWVPFIAGLAMTMIGAGLSVLSTSVLPHWLGWIALVVGVVSLAGPGGFLGFFAAPLWLLVTGVMLFLQPEAEVSVPRARTDASTDAAPRRTTPTG